VQGKVSIRHNCLSVGCFVTGESTNMVQNQEFTESRITSRVLAYATIY